MTNDAYNYIMSFFFFFNILIVKKSFPRFSYTMFDIVFSLHVFHTFYNCFVLIIRSIVCFISQYTF